MNKCILIAVSKFTKDGHTTRYTYTFDVGNGKTFRYITGGWSLKGKAPCKVSGDMFDEVVSMVLRFSFKVVRRTKSGFSFSLR